MINITPFLRLPEYPAKTAEQQQNQPTLNTKQDVNYGSYQSKQKVRLDELPPEIQQLIANRVGVRDRVRWSQANKHTMRVLAQQVNGDHLAAVASKVADFDTFQTLLGSEIQTNDGTTNTIKNLAKDPKRDALRALAPRIVVLPLYQQVAAKNHLLDAINALPEQHRSSLAEAEQQEKSVRMTAKVVEVNDLDSFLKQIGSKDIGIKSLRPDLRVKPLVALMGRLAMLPDAQQMRARKKLQRTFATLPVEYSARYSSEIFH